MSETKNLRLFKHNEPLETNENKFDIDLALNQNWDKIEEFAGMVNDKVIELEDKDEEQDFNLQELQNEIKKDRENMINLEVEGQSIHIEDSSDLEGQLEVSGNVEQDVREGYNLYDYIPRVMATTKGLNVTKDIENGYLIVNGTPETNYISIVTGIGITDILKDKVTYTLWQEKYDNKLYLQVVGRKRDGTGYEYFSATNQKKTFTVDKSKYNGYTINIQTGLTTESGTFNNYKNRYMLYEGTEEKTYEPYGASPSPEYPSEIRAVGDNINLWDKENMLVELGGYSGSNGNKYDSTTRIRNTKDIELKKGIYTLSAEDSKLISVYIVNLKKEISSNGDSATFILEEDGTIRFTIENTALLNTKIKLERGNKKTSYSPYGQGSVEIKKQNKNLFDILKYPFTKKVAYAPNGQLNYWAGYYGITEYFPVEENSNYVFSNDLNKPITYGLMFYNKNKEFISGIVENTTKFITPKNCKYIRFSLQSDTIPNKVQVEHGDKATEIVEHQEQTKILPIQKPMLEGDYFIKEADGWKEVHKLEKKIFNGTERFGNIENTGSVKYFTCFEVLNTYKYLDDNTANFMSNCFKSIPVSQRYKDNTFFINSGKNPIFSSNSFSTTEEFKAKLVELYNANNPMYIHYELATPIKLPCTPEQTKVLDELDNFQTYKPVTNITTDSIAKLKLKYIADTKTYVDNKVNNLEQQVSVINQLLSTTKTSSVLLDNLQTDIEREVL